MNLSDILVLEYSNAYPWPVREPNFFAFSIASDYVDCGRLLGFCMGIFCANSIDFGVLRRVFFVDRQWGDTW